MRQTGKASVEEVAAKVQTKADLCEIALLNYKRVPSLKSSATMEEYLIGVLEGMNWCPSYGLFSPRPCPRPPSKEVLWVKLQDVAKSKNTDLGIHEKHLPDKPWMVDALDVPDPECEIFKPGYLPPARK